MARDKGQKIWIPTSSKLAIWKFLHKNSLTFFGVNGHYGQFLLKLKVVVQRYRTFFAPNFRKVIWSNCISERSLYQQDANKAAGGGGQPTSSLLPAEGHVSIFLPFN